MFNCHFGFPPEEGSSTYWTHCTPYIRCQVDQVQDLTILLACHAYSSLTTGLFYWQPCFKREFLGRTEDLSLQGPGVANARGQY